MNIHTVPEKDDVRHPWRPLFWEPVAGTGERLMVGVVHSFGGTVRATRILRDDVLDCLFGKASAGARRLIDSGLQIYESAAAAAGIEAVGVSIMGMYAGELRATAASNVGDLLRDAALLYSSLANLDKLDDLDESDAPQQEEVSRRFSTEVRDTVIKKRPDLESNFGRTSILVDGGEPVRFGFCSMNSVIHFCVLHPVRQSSSVRDARARLWEVSRAMHFASIPLGCLVCAVPRNDDATLGSRQRDSIRKNIQEIEREADLGKMRFLPVTTVDEGAARVIEFA